MLRVPSTPRPLLLTNVAFVMSADCEPVIVSPASFPSANNTFHMFIPHPKVLSTSIPALPLCLKAL